VNTPKAIGGVVDSAYQSVRDAKVRAGLAVSSFVNKTIPQAGEDFWQGAAEEQEKQKARNKKKLNR
jgi:hypothetical protein